MGECAQVTGKQDTSFCKEIEHLWVWCLWRHRNSAMWTLKDCPCHLSPPSDTARGLSRNVFLAYSCCPGACTVPSCGILDPLGLLPLPFGSRCLGTSERLRRSPEQVVHPVLCGWDRPWAFEQHQRPVPAALTEEQQGVRPRCGAGMSITWLGHATFPPCGHFLL